MNGPEWKPMTDWSSLPDVYVTKVECAHGMFWRVEACSVPAILLPEMRLIRADLHQSALADRDREIARLQQKLDLMADDPGAQYFMGIAEGQRIYEKLKGAPFQVIDSPELAMLRDQVARLQAELAAAKSSEHGLLGRLETCRQDIARLQQGVACFGQMNRDTFEAMCAMRNDLNELFPMPSLESDLLQGPENSVFCAEVVKAVKAHIDHLQARLKAGPTVAQLREWAAEANRVDPDAVWPRDVMTNYANRMEAANGK